MGWFLQLIGIALVLLALPFLFFFGLVALAVILVLGLAAMLLTRKLVRDPHPSQEVIDGQAVEVDPGDSRHISL